MAVERDQPAPGEQHLPAAGQLPAGLGHGDPARQPPAGPNPPPRASTARGRARASARDRGRVGARVVAVHGDHRRARGARGGADRGDGRVGAPAVDEDRDLAAAAPAGRSRAAWRRW